MRNVLRLNEGVEFAERVYINNDSTPRERAKYRELKEEVQRRVEAGENDLIIRNLAIVKRKLYNNNMFISYSWYTIHIKGCNRATRCNKIINE